MTRASAATRIAARTKPSCARFCRIGWASAHIKARGMVADPGHPKLAAAPLVPQPVLFGGARPPTARAPLLGEHSAAVLADVLGLNAAEIESLRRDRVI